MFVRTRTPRAVGLHVVFETLRDLHHVHAIFEENRLQLRVAEDLATVLRVLQILLVDITPHQARILQQSDLVCNKKPEFGCTHRSHRTKKAPHRREIPSDTRSSLPISTLPNPFSSLHSHSHFHFHSLSHLILTLILMLLLMLLLTLSGSSLSSPLPPLPRRLPPDDAEGISTRHLLAHATMISTDFISSVPNTAFITASFTMHFLSAFCSWCSRMYCQIFFRQSLRVQCVQPITACNSGDALYDFRVVTTVPTIEIELRSNLPPFVCFSAWTEADRRARSAP